jgi:hypothetical protein
LKYCKLGRTGIEVSAYCLGNLEETLSALTDLVHGGKVRSIGYIGLSGVRGGRSAGGRRAACLERFRSEQPPYSIINRSSNAKCCRSVCAMGWARWFEARGARAFLPADTARTNRPTPTGPVSRRSTSTTSASSTWSNSSSRLPRRPANDPPGDGLRDRPPGRYLCDPLGRAPWNSSTICWPVPTSP